jgi:hypothetical protein
MADEKKQRFNYGHLSSLEVDKIIPETCWRMQSNIDFSTETQDQKMQERCQLFNVRRAKKSWSQSDMNFFAQTLATSFDKKQQ